MNDVVETKFGKEPYRLVLQGLRNTGVLIVHLQDLKDSAVYGQAVGISPRDTGNLLAVWS